ncbi:MAG TPA: prolyl oligopeptidase family serine peptidase [Pirellulaceae bacterium]|nr:prolyl oligopeptidase family serine peptidase [Pirellulaceae bacterium]
MPRQVLPGLLLGALAAVGGVDAEPPAVANSDAATAGTTAIPPAIRPYFEPPEKFRGQYGTYRDVMKFDDGTSVETPADWPKRRAELLSAWHETLGPWKEVNVDPKLEPKEQEHVENFTRHKVELEVAPGRFQDAYLLIPDGEGPFPAVLVLWYNATESAGIPKQPGDPLPSYAFGYDLAKRGFVTLCLGGPGVTMDEGVQPLSFYAYTAANAYHALAKRKEVDPDRIGVTGFSMGGKWALFAACLYEKFACAVWVDPGIVWNEEDSNANYWDKWYLGAEEGKERPPGVVTEQNPRTGAYKQLVEEGRDLHELHALMAPRPFLVSGGAQDPPEHWVALNHAIRLNKFLGYENRVAMTNRDGHSPTPESNEAVYAFFERFLKPNPSPERSGD